MLTAEIVQDVFSRLNEMSEIDFSEVFVMFQIVPEEDVGIIYATLGAIIEAHTVELMPGLGLAVADPRDVAAKAFLAGVLCGRTEIRRAEEEV